MREKNACIELQRVSVDDFKSLVSEARTLAEWHSEIVITGIHIGSYGVDIGSSLELTADTLFLVPMRRAVLQARDSIVQGESLSASIELTNRFPPDIPPLINSGEETGRLPEMMLSVMVSGPKLLTPPT